MTHKPLEDLQNAYSRLPSSSSYFLIYVNAYPKFFTPEECGVIQDKIFAYLNERGLGYAHLSWGYIAFPTTKDLSNEIRDLINEEKLATLTLLIDDDRNLVELFKEGDQRLHDQITDMWQVKR